MTTQSNLAASQTRSAALGRVDLPPATRNALQSPPSDSSSALFTQKGDSSPNGTNEALRAGGTRKKRDRLQRPSAARWPNAQSERTKHKRQQQEQLDQRRREQEQHDATTRTLSKTQALASHQHRSTSTLVGNAPKGGSSAVDHHASAPTTSRHTPTTSRPRAHQTPSAGWDPARYSSTAKRANLGPSFPSPVGLPSVPSGNNDVTEPAGPVGWEWARAGHETAGAYGSLSGSKGGHRKTGLARIVAGQAVAPFSFSHPQQFEGACS